jgi:hypothetical protein
MSVIEEPHTGGIGPLGLLSHNIKIYLQIQFAPHSKHGLSYETDNVRINVTFRRGWVTIVAVEKQ